ncbi:hypothetical protein [Mesorhizobium caraganae]|uniref:hypothetical protein n=1 Tax=Mesorhizobium caraganae TaxID=483206 RepID=UPI003337F2AB
MSAPIELRNSPTNKFSSVAGSLLMVAIFGFYTLKGLVSGADGGRVLLVALLALGFLGLGGYIARAPSTPRSRWCSTKTASAIAASATCWCHGTRW